LPCDLKLRRVLREVANAHAEVVAAREATLQAQVEDTQEI
jgi:hypothetical protein